MPALCEFGPTPQSLWAATPDSGKNRGHRMNELGRFFRGLWGRLTLGSPARPVTLLKVSNLTRQTVLATRMAVADQGETRRKGLLGRKGLPPGEGLWIIPCEAVHTFGMQFSIDLVYLDRKNRIRKLRSEVPPWRLSACLTAHSVMELAPGTIRNSRTEPGDILEFASEPSAKESCEPELEV